MSTSTPISLPCPWHSAIFGLCFIWVDITTSTGSRLPLLALLMVKHSFFNQGRLAPHHNEFFFQPRKAMTRHMSAYKKYTWCSNNNMGVVLFPLMAVPVATQSWWLQMLTIILGANPQHKWVLGRMTYVWREVWGHYSKERWPCLNIWWRQRRLKSTNKLKTVNDDFVPIFRYTHVHYVDFSSFDAPYAATDLLSTIHVYICVLQM